MSGQPPHDAAAAAAPTVSAAPPNEGGLVPILEYHRIVAKAGLYDRTPNAFRRDLARLYKEGYRPVLLQDLVRGKVDLPRGASPVVLTFDDADASQFRYLPGTGERRVDPDCAVGILRAFARAHPDFPAHATFYVLPESAFGPARERPEKFRTLRDEMGCEIGNHTVTHRSLRAMSDAAVAAEIGGCVAKIQAILPGTKVESIALPMGISPKNRALLVSGTGNGQRYTNKAVLLVGANPAPSPFSPEFKPLRLPRIQAVEGPLGITYWLDYLKKPGRRFVSDGDPARVTLPATAARAAAR
jgi:peptidoglycan/xylan/chitin deacetylase (PgdA/CDA1 family)